MRALRIIGGIVAFLVVILVIIAAAVWFGRTRLVVWAIEHPVSHVLGRQIRVAGGLSVDLGDTTKVVMQDVHVANPSWDSQNEMLAAQRIEIDFKPRTLIAGPAEVSLVALDGAKLLLEKSAQGDANWKFTLHKAATPQKREEFPRLMHFQAHGSQFTYRNGTTNAQTVLGVNDVDLTESDPSAPVDLKFDGDLQKQQLKFTGQFGSVDEMRNPTKPYPIKINDDFGSSKLSAEGTIKEPLQAEGVDLRIQMQGRKLDDLIHALGLPFPQLPDFKGTARITSNAGNWAVEDLDMTTGASNLQGNVTLDAGAPGKPPHVKATLTSRHLELADFKGLYGGKPAHSSEAAKPPKQPGHVIPDTAFDLKKLPKSDVELSFKGDQVKPIGQIPIEQVVLAVRIADGKLVVQPLRFHTARGDVDLNMTYTLATESAQPRLQAAVNIRHVDLHELLRNFNSPMVNQTAGVVGGGAKIDTSGVSSRDFLARMNGTATIFLQDGRISQLLQELAPLNVLGALGVYASGDKPVPIKCMVGQFDIGKGVANAKTLLLETQDTQIAGSGNINFGEETLNLDFHPRSKKFTAISLHTPVHVKGTFAKPDFSLDSANLIARAGAAIGLGILFPPAALLPLIDTGLGEHNACATAYAQHNAAASTNH